MSKQWKCPECGGKQLTAYHYVSRWACANMDCLEAYAKKTIQALVASARVPSASAIAFQTLQNISKRGMHQTFTTSPPGFLMPWEQAAKQFSNSLKPKLGDCYICGAAVNQPHYSDCSAGISIQGFAAHLQSLGASKCDCGGEKTGGAHSSWCSKESK